LCRLSLANIKTLANFETNSYRLGMYQWTADLVHEDVVPNYESILWYHQSEAIT
jgi:hypothetical protein